MHSTMSPLVSGSPPFLPICKTCESPPHACRRCTLLPAATRPRSPGEHLHIVAPSPNRTVPAAFAALLPPACGCPLTIPPSGRWRASRIPRAAPRYGCRSGQAEAPRCASDTWSPWKARRPSCSRLGARSQGRPRSAPPKRSVGGGGLTARTGCTV
jgi:hypothetical protein